MNQETLEKFLKIVEVSIINSDIEKIEAVITLLTKEVENTKRLNDLLG